MSAMLATLGRACFLLLLGTSGKAEPLGSDVALVQTALKHHLADASEILAPSEPQVAEEGGLWDDTRKAARAVLLLEEGSAVHGHASLAPALKASAQVKQVSMARQLAVPVAAIVLGAMALQVEATKLVGKLFLFFGAQTFMNLYMKAVLSKSPVDADRHMYGIPAAFAITAIQQLVSFALLVVGATLSHCTPWAYTPKLLTTPRQLGMVLCFSLSFTLNIALNNFSLSMLDISVNLIIRSIAPLTTLIVQVVFTRCLGAKTLEPVEIGLMIAGVVCGLIAVCAKGQGLSAPGESSHLIFGGLICLFSLFSAGMELVLAGLLGSGLGLNPIDTTFYMALPTTLLLLVPVFLVPHSISWPGHGPMTDFQILSEVVGLSPGTFVLALLSGAFAMVYNILLYTIVQTLSPAFSAFTSNFNKAATIALSVLLGFELLPEAPWGSVMAVGIAGNLAAFTAYGMYKTRPKSNKK